MLDNLIASQETTNWDMWTAIGTWVLAIGTLTAVWLQKRSNDQLIQAQTFAIYTARWDSSEMRENRKTLASYFLSSKEDQARFTPPERDDLLGFFEDLGSALKHGHLRKDMVWHSFSDSILYYWKPNEEYMMKYREEMSDPTYFSEYEYLAKQMKKIKKNKRLPEISDVDLKDFLVGETELNLHHPSPINPLL